MKRGAKKLLNTPDEIVSVCELYYVLDVSIPRIAERMRVSAATIRRVINEHGADFVKGDRTGAYNVGVGNIGTIRIAGEIEAASELLKNRKHWYVISMRATRVKKCQVDPFSDLARDFLPVWIDDVWEDSQLAEGNRRYATQDEVAAVIAWASGKDPLLVHCQAGVSRSSAIAYLIASARSNPAEAIKLLHPALHTPNMHLVRLGAVILGNPEVETVAAEYNRKAKEAGICGVF